MSEQDYATARGTKQHRNVFAHKPWERLAVGDAPLNAERIETVRPPVMREDGICRPDPEVKRAVAARIMQSAKEHRLGVSEIDPCQKQHPTSRTAVPVLLTGLGPVAEAPAGVALHRHGAQLRKIDAAVTGAWVKEAHAFSIMAEDLIDMVRNFEKRKNDMIVIDYEHASEMPEVAKGGPVPAAGWIHELHIDKSGIEKLAALVEWTPEAEEMIQTGEYRFFSPAIDWGATDKDTGEPQGATLTSGALTNHPFLEELPPIMLSDGKVLAAGLARLNDGSGLYPLRYEGARNMKKMTLKPIPEGEEQGGDHAVFEEGSETPAGFIPHSELSSYAAKHLGANPDEEEDTEASLDGETEGESQKIRADARESCRRSFFLREAVRKGKIDAQRAAALAESGRITLAEYIHAQEAERLIESAIACGKLLPRDRAFFFRDAMERPKEFLDYVRNAAPAVRLGSKGIGSGETVPVDEEVHLGVRRLMNESGLDYAKALKEFLSANPSLGEQYRYKHTRPAHSETTAQ